MQRSRIESRSSTGSLVNAGALAVATMSIMKQINRCRYSTVRQEVRNDPYNNIHGVVQAVALAPNVMQCKSEKEESRFTWSRNR
jgi:hypothetical protein